MAARDALSSSDLAGKKLLQTTSVREEQGSLAVNERHFQGEIRTFKRKHVLRSPQIIITCPADSVRQAFVCRACSAGPVCCADLSEENKESFSVDQRVSWHGNGNDDYDGEGPLTCSECGSIYSENSDWSSSSSENGHDPEPFATSPLKKFTSIDNLNVDYSESNHDLFSAQQSNCGSETLSSSSTSGNEDEDDEDVILVHIDRDLRGVVDNHIRSRKNSINTSEVESFKDGRSCSPAKEMPSSKESEILQKFLQQVETHPQAEDLDVILEIVGEEDEEPCSRSKVNIRECTEKFKDIYARKLKEIYHRKYKNFDFRSETQKHSKNNDLTDFKPGFNLEEVGSPGVTLRSLSRAQSELSESTLKSGVNNSTEHIKNSTVAFIDSQQPCESSNSKEVDEPKTILPSIKPHTKYSKLSQLDTKSFKLVNSVKPLGSTVTGKNQMTIDKLPEIRQFHPNNIDPKIPLEDRTYLKATSLINEIESCFRETALLVEKSIGSDKAPLYVLKSEIETQKLRPDTDRYGNSSSAIKRGIENNRTEKENYSSYQYDIPKDERILNEYQSIWNSVESDLPSPLQYRNPVSQQNDFFMGNKKQCHSPEDQQLIQQNAMRSNADSSDSGRKESDSDERYVNPLSNLPPDFSDANTEHRALGIARIDVSGEAGGDFKFLKHEFKSPQEDVKVNIDRVPRTLEESIEIFEMILDDRRSESRKSYDSGLSSSTLVLSSSKFLKENSIESSERSSKYNSTNDLLCVSDDDYFNQTWTLGRKRNKFKSAFHLEDKYTPKNNTSHSKLSTEISNSSNDRLRTGSEEINANLDELGFLNSYKKFDSFDLLCDFDRNITENNSKSNSKSLTGKPEIVESHNRFSSKKITSYSKTKVGNRKFDSSLMDDDKGSEYRREKRHTIPSKCNQILNQWKSEPDFGKLAFPSFGFQSSSSEEYYDKDYLTTSITTSSFKDRNKFREDPIKQTMAYQEENGILRKENASCTIENEPASISSGTMGILNEQPLFAQVDELLKGLCESRVDSSSESDEGVVSDQSDISELHLPERFKCASVSEIMEAIDGSNGDEELEKNVEQIVHGINSIKEKHLGRKIEEELENYIWPKLELLRENISTNLSTSTSSGGGKKILPVISVDERKLSIEQEAADLSEKIKKLAELPEIRDVIAKMNQQSTKSLWKFQVSNELNAMEQISQASDELKSLGFVTDGIDFSRNLKNRLPRRSRKEEFERHLTMRQTDCSNDHVNVTRTSTRSSSCFSFFDESDSGSVSDLSDGHIEHSRQRTRECSLANGNVPLESQCNRNSFIMKMLHQNLRSYVITLAFLEKLLNDDVHHQDSSSIGDRSKFFDNFNSATSEIPNLGFAALEKAVAMLPGIAEHNASSGPPTASPYDIGHEAFLRGLRRQHLVETQRYS